MQAHRFQNLIGAEKRLPDEVAGPSGEGFMLCLVPSAATAQEESWRQEVYRIAFEQARAVMRPAWTDRDVLGTWN